MKGPSVSVAASTDSDCLPSLYLQSLESGGLAWACSTHQEPIGTQYNEFLETLGCSGLLEPAAEN